MTPTPTTPTQWVRALADNLPEYRIVQVVTDLKAFKGVVSLYGPHLRKPEAWETDWEGRSATDAAGAIRAAFPITGYSDFLSVIVFVTQDRKVTVMRDEKEPATLAK